MIKKTPNGLYVRDDLTLDLAGVKPELKDNFVKRVRDFEEAGRVGVSPKLVVSVAATHAGLPTGNMAFYTPDRMKAGLPSFTKDFSKPVLLHHNDMKDPVGRVYRASYKDLSNRYIEPMQQFKERYGGDVFTDAKEKVDLEKSFDQVDWILENMVPMNDYVGLGYGELDLHITDGDAAEKIMDQRYLTVSVGFTTDSMFCSNCHQDWASEGICEHERGKTYDDKQTLLIPGSFNYEEISFVNSPADVGASVLSVSETPSLADNTIDSLETLTNSQDSKCVPILISVHDGKVSRLDSYKRVTPERAQEVTDVAKQEEKTQPEVELIKFTVGDTEVDFPKEAEEFLTTEDAKHENYLTSEEHGHMHRVIIDPATGNGYTSYDGTHAHEVVNKVLSEGGDGKWNETTDKYEVSNPHTHDIDKKIPALTDDKDDDDKVEDKKKKKYKKTSDDIEGDDELELDDDADVPEGYELVEDSQEEDEELSIEDQRKAIEDDEDLTTSQKARKLFELAKQADDITPATEFEVVEIELVDPSNEDASIKLAFTSEEGFKESLEAMTVDAIAANVEELEKACTVFGIELSSVQDTEATGAAGSPLTKAQAQANAEALFNKIDESFIDKLMEGMNKIGDDEARKELAGYIVDKLIEEAMIDDIFAAYNALQSELQDTQEKLASVTKSNRDFYASKQDDLARVVVALKVALKKPEFVDLNEEDLATRTKELKVRSVDSLQDSFDDLVNEFSGKKEVEPSNDDVLKEPVEPVVGNVIDSKDETTNRHDMKIFKGMSDRQYRLAMNLQNRFKKEASK